MLQRLARTSYHRRWWVVAAWLVLLVGLNALNSAAGGTFRDEFKLPGSESQDAVDLLQAKGFDTLGGLPGHARGPGHRRRRGEQPRGEAYVDDLLEQIGASVPDTEVVSPYSEEGARQVSEDGTIAYAEIDLAERDSNEFTDAGTTIREVVDDAEADLPPATQVELGGDIFVEPAEFSSEGVGLLAARDHPAHRLRLGAGHGPADHDRAVRHRLPASRWSAWSSTSSTCRASPTRPWP